MKRFFITFLLASFTMLFVNAQSKHTVYVWVDGEKTTIENVDSLTFIEEVAPQYVDLGLSVKWATCNLGAATPEEIGNYYAWGETTPKDTYYKKNYKYHDGTEYTKYTEDDGLLELEAMDDAATANLGEDWRMPTYDEIEELQNNCTWTWTEKDGCGGFTVTSTINGNSIFMPGAGDFYEDEVYRKGDAAEYWTNESPVKKTFSYYAVVFRKGGMKIGDTERFTGLTIRPVYVGAE
ncbi:hypothetical protein [Prevotella pectinovora]|uniref:hypothetical protein n=1 Tax=Prevotella pectinovora TaxID=1602169 RepID=UPI00259ADA54|nr:hypothetical protein [uncultured Prevotella sp.]